MSILAEKPADANEHPTQNFGTPGIKPLERPSAVTRAFMAAVAFVERLNLKYSKVGNPPIYDKAVFPWTAEIEREWRAIRAELDHVLTRKDELPGFHEIVADVAAISQDRGWKSFLLCRLRLQLRGQYPPVPADLAHLPENPRPDHGHVFYPRAGQAFAAASRTL